MPRGAGASKTVAKLAPGGTEAETDRDRRNRDKTGGTEPSEMGVPLTGGWPWLGAKRAAAATAAVAAEAPGARRPRRADATRPDRLTVLPDLQ